MRSRVLFLTVLLLAVSIVSVGVLIKITPFKIPTPFVLVNDTPCALYPVGLNVTDHVLFFCNATLVSNESITLKLTDMFIGTVAYLNATLCVNNTCINLAAGPSEMKCRFVKTELYEFYICEYNVKALEVSGKVFNISYIMHEPSLYPVLEVICESCHIECRG